MQNWINNKVGCRHSLDNLSDQNIPICDSIKVCKRQTSNPDLNFQELQLLASYEQEFILAGLSSTENKTKCLRNCEYFVYSKFIETKMNGDPEMRRKNESWLMIKAASSKIKVKKQTLIYPLVSFLAEMGGSLGLFLGFSLMMVWDGFEKIIYFFFSHHNK